MKKRLLFIPVLICLLSFNSKSQIWQWAIQAGGTSSDYSGGLDIDDVGNSYIVGTFYDSLTISPGNTLVSPGLWSVYIAKYDGAGILVWAKVVASDSAISSSGICVDKHGRISITGHYTGNATFGIVNPVTLVSSGDYDVFVAQYDSTMRIMWAKSSGGSGMDYSGGISTDNKGNVFITGDFHITSFPASASKVFVTKYDSVGNCPWSRMPAVFGNFHYGMGIKTDTSGNSYVAGQFFSSLIFDSAHILNAGNIEANIFIAKFDNEGGVVWINRAGAATGYAGASAIDVDDAGYSYITGYYRGTISFFPLSLPGPSGISYDIFVAKCDPNGNFEWVNSGNGPASLDEGRGISADNNGGCYVTGYFAGNFTLGSVTLVNSGNTNNVFLAKTDASGNFVWANQCGGLRDINVSGIKSNTHGVFVTGNFIDTIKFGSTIALVNDTLKYDNFLAKLDNTTGILKEQNSISSIIAFPNPANDYIYLFGLHEKSIYVLTDITGKIICDGVTENENKFPVANLAKGIYFIRLLGKENESGKISEVKFIKL